MKHSTVILLPVILRRGRRRLRPDARHERNVMSVSHPRGEPQSFAAGIRANFDYLNSDFQNS